MKFAGDSSALTLLRRDELRRKALQFLLRANYLSKTKLRLMFQAQEPPHRHTGESDAAQYGEHQENEQLHPERGKQRADSRAARPQLTFGDLLNVISEAESAHPAWKQFILHESCG